MDSSCIPYTRVPRSSALLVDYLSHFDRVGRFYNGNPFDPASYKGVAGQLGSFLQPRSELADILARQNQAFGCSEPTFENIARLRDPATFSVVTGQQVGLISGPAFTIYKALTAIRLANWLSEQGLPAVPIFWLATEDHDLQEVAEASTLDEDYSLVHLSDPGVRPAPRSSVGYVKLSAGIEEALNRLEALLPPSESRGQLLADLRTSYQPGVTWGQAFGRFMARLFSRWGVVLIDPLDEALHRQSAPVYARALRRARDLRERLRQRSQELVRAGYHAQVHVVDGSTLVFVAREENRLPIIQGEDEQLGQFMLDGAEPVTLRELEAWLEDRPRDFSPNVLLRPLLQDTLLPTVAYVAGPSELAYLGQAQTLYADYGRPMPVIFPRAGFTLVDRRSQRLMEKYRVSLEDVWKGEEHLSRKIAAAGAGGAENWSERLDQTEREFTELLDRLRNDIERLDPTLVDSVKHAQEKMTYQLERLRGKVSRAALEHSELLSRHEQSLVRFLTPRRNLQEREVTGVYFLGRAGYELLERLLGQVQIGCPDHQVVPY